MKTLVITRHGKSSWDDYNYDWERKLTEKGKRNARQLGKFLKEKGIVPDLIVSSFATRALDTAKIVAEETGYNMDDIDVRKEIYHNDLDGMLDLIYGLDNGYDTVFLFGHNPTFTDLVNHFAQNKIEHLRTAGSFGVRFDTNNWEEVETAPSEDVFFIVPR